MEPLQFYAEEAYKRYCRTLGLTYVIPFQKLPSRVQLAWLESVLPYHLPSDN